MDEVTKNKTLERLTKAESIWIVVSKNAEFDALASALGLYLSFSKLGKNVAIYAKDPSVGDAQRVYGVDKINKASGKKTLVLAINNAVNTVDKVTYFLDKDRLKILVHSLPASSGVTKDQVSFEQESAKPDILFILGFESIDQLNKEIDHEQLLDSAWVVSLNCKKNLREKFAQVSLFSVDSDFGELVAGFIQDLALPVDEDIAYNLYAACSSSTDNFSPAKTKPVTLQVASWLIKFGAGKASLANSSTLDQNFKAFEEKQVEEVPIDQVEIEKSSERDWLEPPKIYKGSKSFDSKY